MFVGPTSTGNSHKIDDKTTTLHLKKKLLIFIHMQICFMCAKNLVKRLFVMLFCNIAMKNKLNNITYDGYYTSK